MLVLKNIVKTFSLEGRPVEILKGVSFSIHAGEIVGLVGLSGAGKTTLLQIAGLLEQPSGGTISIGGERADMMNERERTQVRSKQIGFVYQSHRLLPDFSAVENVMIPQLIARVPRERAQAQAEQLLCRVGLAGRLHHRPAQLSGGEQQRVAIARSLSNKPTILLADEPTGNLDSKTAEDVFRLFLEVVRDHNVAAFVATHNMDLARRMDKMIHMQDGKVIG